MREISVELVKKTVEELCVKANLYLPDGMKEKINSCIGCEKSPLSKQVLGDIVRNIDCAKELEVPTGRAFHGRKSHRGNKRGRCKRICERQAAFIGGRRSA